MGLSSNIIWHQTNYKGLEQIIKGRCFKCSYSLEEIHWKSSHLKVAFPMISFCDIPLSDMGEYLGKYGKYTIGIKREWSKKNGLSSVWYQGSHSDGLVHLCGIADKTLVGGEIDIEALTDIEKMAWNTLAYVKNYEGSLPKYGFSSYRFYDERENRFVPNMSQLKDNGVDLVLPKSKYDDYKEAHNNSSIIENIALQFALSDIEFILISAANQHSKVRKLLGKDGENIIIMSYDQVKKDIIGLNHYRATE